MTLAGVVGMQLKKYSSRCMLYSIGLLAVLAVFATVLTVALIGVQAYPAAARKQLCLDTVVTIHHLQSKGILKSATFCNFLFI